MQREKRKIVLRLENAVQFAAPRDIDAHYPGERHAENDGEKGQKEILDSDDLVIAAEDVLAQETLG